MNDRTLVDVARFAALTGAVLAVGGVLAIVFTTNYSEPFWADGSGLSVLLSVFFALFVWLVIPQQPQNLVVWSMVVSGFFGGVYLAGYAAAASLVADPNMILGDSLVPAGLPVAAAFLVMVATVGVYLAIYAWLTFGLLLFPDGTLPSPRWRWVGALAVAGLFLLMANAAWQYGPWHTLPASEDTALGNLGGGLVTLAAILSLVALFVRFRRSTGAARDQFKWVVWGAAIVVPWFTAAFFVGGNEGVGVILVPLHVAVAAMLGAYGIAVGRYRLFDIDVVMSRTVVYGALAAFITGAYVVTVVGVGGLLGADAEASPWLSIGATALVAFAFEPMREWLQRLANRLVYGKRATPYEVLSDFARKITGTDDELLGQVARSLAEGTTAAAASVWVARNGELDLAAVWPETSEIAPLVGAEDGTALPDADLVKPVIHDNETLGAVALSAARSQALLPTDERLLEQMASGLGLALRNIRLSEDLRRQVRELGRSRQRLVTVQDETRRHLERQLHDGAQQRLVALKVKLTLTRRGFEAAGIGAVAELLHHVATDTDRAIDSLRDFARGVYPPLLEAEGPAAALVSQTRRFPLPVTVDASGLGRHERTVEAALYFCLLEALQNVVKHAGASSARVVLREDDDMLTFEVSDDGRGFDPASVTWGSGVANLRDRLDAIGGKLEVRSTLGSGTTVTGMVPSQQMELAT